MSYRFLKCFILHGSISAINNQITSCLVSESVTEPKGNGLVISEVEGRIETLFVPTPTTPKSCYGKLGVRDVDLVNAVPVDDVRPRLNVIWTAVLIVQIVGVFPDINAEKWGMSLHDRTVLIGGGIDFQAAVAEDEPCPTGSETCGCSSKKLLFGGIM